MYISDYSNPIYVEKDWPAAVIAGASQTGVLGMRSLIRHGVNAYCFDCDRSQVGFQSVYGDAYICPNPDNDSNAWVEFMIELSSNLNSKPILVSSSDQFISAIAINENTLSKHFVLSPGLTIQCLLATKETQYRLAKKHGMPLPFTSFVKNTKDIQSFADQALFPCLLKPIHFREWQLFPETHPLHYKKIVIAETPGDLLEYWQLASEVNPNLIVQEIIQGLDTDKRVYLSCYDRKGIRIGRAMFRELRCFPPGFGPATVSEPVVDNEADEICNRFLNNIGYSGICEIEMKRDSRDGRLKLIEANPRLSGGGDAAPYAGVDLCWLHYLDMIGVHVNPVEPNGRDFRHVVFRVDGAAIFSNKLARLISWNDVIKSYKPPLVFYDLDPKDFLFSIKTVYRMIRAAIGVLVKWIL